MALSGISENMGLYTQHNPKRPHGEPGYRPHVEPGGNDADQQSAGNGQAQARPATALSRHKPRYPNAAYQEAAKQYQGEDPFSRVGTISRNGANAINTYQQFSNYEKREEITQMLGVDVYV